MKTNLLKSIAISAMICSCSNIIYHKEGGYRAKDPQYVCLPAKRGPAAFELVDTCAIYVHQSIYRKPPYIAGDVDQLKDGDTLYRFYRFFGNGKFFVNVRMLNRFPTNEDINFFYTGVIGSYCIEGNAIKIHFFSLRNGGTYDTHYGNLFQDSMHFEKERADILFPIKSRLREPYAIVRVKEPWMKFWAQPEW